MAKEKYNPKEQIKKALEEPGENVFESTSTLVGDARRADALDSLLETIQQEIKELEDPVSVAKLRMTAALIHQSGYDYDSAWKEAETVSREKGLPTLLQVYALDMLASVCMSRFDFAAAEAYAKQALGLTSDSTGGAPIEILNLMGDVYRHQHKFYLALEYFLELREACEKKNYEEGYAVAISNLALTYNLLGRFAEGEKHLIESLALAKKADNKVFIAISHSNIASHFIMMERYDEALEHVEKSLDIAREMKDERGVSNRLLVLARIYRETGRKYEALGHARTAYEIAEEKNFQGILPAGCRVYGAALADAGDPEAMLYLDKSIKMYLSQSRDEAPHGLEMAYLEYGKLLVDKDEQTAAEHIWKAINILKKRPRYPFLKRKLAEAENIAAGLPKISELESTSIEISQENLAKILDVSNAIISETELSGTLEKILDIALEISGAERGVIWIRGEAKLGLANAKNFSGPIKKEPDYPAINQVAWSVVGTGRELTASGSAEVRKKTGEIPYVEPMDVKSFFAFPLAADGKTVGVLYLDSRFAAVDFSESIRGLLLSIMKQAAMVIEKIRHIEEMGRESSQLKRKVKQQDNELKSVFGIVEKQQKELEGRYGIQNIIGHSPRMRAVFELIDKAAQVDLPVTIYGESGTGKELVARALHYGGPRKEGLFVPINCASIPENLLEAELFGYEKGAFTGAVETREGLFEVSSGGTLMLDEIGDMSAQMQAKLLRVIEENRVRRLGGRHEIKVNVRIVTASNKKLEYLVEAGEFREDLFYRLNVIHIKLPLLRERREDIPLMVDHFWKKAAGAAAEVPPDKKQAFMRVLMKYKWPGNVRELENEIERIIALGGTMDAGFLSENIITGLSSTFSVDGVEETGLNLREVEIRLIERALRAADGNKAQAARLMGIAKTSLYDKLRKYGIDWTGRRTQ
ncbi:MAG: tetratricopeptide repeat protein [Planctomycetota bacterium]|nr:MAG: tetratricopeptide repeat protein [Planctomycetota bacterium]